MLLEFRAKNYKSFKDELVFSMIPAPKQKGLDYSILSEKIRKKEYKGLSSAVVYGANASGKTNIIGAMDTFKRIVLRGNIHNAENSSPNMAAYKLELIPNNSDECEEPVSFFIKFIEEGYIFEYSFSIYIGKFLDLSSKRKVIKEYLKINDVISFDREDSVLKVTPSQDYIGKFGENIKDIIDNIVKKNLNDEELFLTNGFKNIFDSKVANIIINWLNAEFNVIYRADNMQFIPPKTAKIEEISFINDIINEGAKLFGINSNGLIYASDDNGKISLGSSFMDNKGKEAIIPAEIYESYGTIRFANIFPLVIVTLVTGGVLVVDEFDASIHPMVLMNIINIFHNDELNKKHAQLIFNTHNPIFLNSNLFRRDEIKFVERDDDTHCSTLYSLSDFGTAGRGGVRKNEDYMKNYFVDRYGAIRDIDFTPIIERFLKEEKEV